MEERLKEALAEIDVLRGRVSQLEELLKFYSTETSSTKVDAVTQTLAPNYHIPKDDWASGNGVQIYSTTPSTSSADPLLNHPSSEGLSVAEMVRATAEAVVMEQEMPGYVFQPDSNLYYSHDSGYYYDPKSKLFYHPSTQLYYFYDSETKEFRIMNTNGTESAAPVEYSNRKYKRQAKKYTRRMGIPPSSLDAGAFETLMDILDEVEVREMEGTSKSKEGDTRRSSKRSYAQLLGSTMELDGVDVIDLTVAEEREEKEEGEMSDDCLLLSASSDSSSSSSFWDSEGEGTEDVLKTKDKWRRRCIYRRKKKEAAKYPPCIRLMEFPKGNLHVVTINGAVFGRNPKDCDIAFADENMSRKHTRVFYESKENDSQSKKKKQNHGGHYYLEDLGSRNGTKLNDSLMETKSKARLTHGDKVEIGSGTVLVIHIHNGNNTCPGCEPGLAASKSVETSLAAANLTSVVATNEEPQVEEPEIVCVGGVSGPALSRAMKERIRRMELKKIKRRYGLAGSEFSKGWDMNQFQGSYQDRAQRRRVTKGSEHPAHQRESQPTTVHKALAADNKGFEMLSKMGWREGSSLGKTNEGIKEPIAPAMQVGKLGLGAGPKVSISNPQAFKKAQMLLKTQERYAKAKEVDPNHITIFEED